MHETKHSAPWVNAYESIFGLRIAADVAAAFEVEVSALVSQPKVSELMAAFRAIRHARDYQYRSPTAGEVADAIKAGRATASRASQPGGDCPRCDGSGVAMWLWPWALGQEMPPQMCVCAFGRWLRQQRGNECAVTEHEVARLLDAADADGCDTAAKRMAWAEGIQTAWAGRLATARTEEA